MCDKLSIAVANKGLVALLAQSINFMVVREVGHTGTEDRNCGIKTQAYEQVS